MTTIPITNTEMRGNFPLPSYPLSHPTPVPDEHQKCETENLNPKIAKKAHR
jgi:hypothetical protein